MSKSPLGRGLSALLGGGPGAGRSASVAGAAAAPPSASPPTSPASVSAPALVAPPAPGEVVRRVAWELVLPSPLQPRKEFAPGALQELADSIREQGVVQPLIVRAQGERFELIAGERRWRASQLAGLREVPVIVRVADDRAVLELALIENLQRENLNPIEEAHGFQQLIEQFQLRQEDVAARVGKSRVAVANALRLLRLPTEVQDMLREGRVAVGHAKVILGLERPEQMRLAAERVVREGLNVRQAEELISHLSAPPAAAPASGPAAPAPAGGAGGQGLPPGVPSRDPHVVAVENQLRERFGTKVGLRYRQGRGSIEIRFFSDDELERILEIVGVRID